MEKYVEQTEIVIGLIQDRMSQLSFEKSSHASERMYKYVSELTESEKLNIHELLNAVGTIFLASLELAMDSTKGEIDDETK